MDKNCLECGDKIVGREDKKFCSDGCRNAYNNKINKDSTNFMRNVNNKLRKNYRILSALNVDGKGKTTNFLPIFWQPKLETPTILFTTKAIVLWRMIIICLLKKKFRIQCYSL